MSEEKAWVVVGASGAIGGALLNQLERHFPQRPLYGLSRTPPSPSKGKVHYLPLEEGEESSLAAAASWIGEREEIGGVIVATGWLHGEGAMPERALKELSFVQLQRSFEVNAIFPALVAKHFLPRMWGKSPALFAALSARVGSISDNRLGGWYGYRASKAALNMFIKTASIEMKRKNPLSVVVGLHPGTVDSPLSHPFQKNLPKGQLFTPTDAAEKLVEVMEHLTPAHSGRCLGWDGKEIAP